MTNSNLITVFNGQISNQSVQLANARELHEFLEVKSQFGHWITDRITDYGFTENEDYIIVTERTAGRPRKEYHITLDMGKELAMVERNEKGRQIRKYFIECEKQARLQNQQQNLPLAPQPERTFTRTFNEQFVFQLGWLWYGHGRMGDLLGKLEPALQAIGSHYAPTVHSHSIEYRRQYQILKPFIAELLADYDIDTFNRHGLNAVLKALDKETRPQLTRN